MQRRHLWEKKKSTKQIKKNIPTARNYFNIVKQCTMGKQGHKCYRCIAVQPN